MASVSVSPREARVIVGVERLASVGWLTVTDDRTWGAGRYPRGGFGGQLPWTWDAPVATHPLRAPRLAVDVALGKALPITVGVSGLYFAPHGRAPGTGYVFDVESESRVWAVAPRVGVLAYDVGRVCFWPKVGIAYGEASSTETLHGISKGGPLPVDVPYEYRVTALDLEPTILVGIVRHFAASASLNVGLPLSASRRGGPDGTVDPAPTQVTASLGLAGWL